MLMLQVLLVNSFDEDLLCCRLLLNIVLKMYSSTFLYILATERVPGEARAHSARTNKTNNQGLYKSILVGRSNAVTLKEVFDTANKFLWKFQLTIPKQS